MRTDISWKIYLSDNERYADLINGIGCNGRQAVGSADLYEIDTQTGVFSGRDFISRLPKSAKQGNIKNRDAIRKAAFGVNFAVIGIESQEEMDYKISLRNMSYDAGEYEKQAARIRKEVRKWGNTGIFKTDVRQVFDFIRYSEDKNALKQLVETDAYYQNMEEDAFDVVACYINAEELVWAKNYHRKYGKVDMCTAIKELIADGRAEGIIEGKMEGKAEEKAEIIRKMILYGMADKDIRIITECEQELIDSIRKTFF